MEILIQAKVPISRPDDFFAEMLKTDEHMAKIKSRLIQQQ
jgi:rRNA-processing protein EBP2